MALTPEQLAQAQAEGRRMASSGMLPAVPYQDDAPTLWEQHFHLIVGVSVLAATVLLLLIGSIFFGGGAAEKEPKPVVPRQVARKKTGLRSRAVKQAERQMRVNPAPARQAEQPPAERQPQARQPEVRQPVDQPPPAARPDAQKHPEMHAPSRIVRPEQQPQQQQPVEAPPPARRDPPVKPPAVPAEQAPHAPQKVACTTCQGTTRLICSRCNGVGQVWRHVVKGGPCSRCKAIRTRYCKIIHCNEPRHKHYNHHHSGYFQRYECEPPDWGFRACHCEFRCKGHNIICNYCGNTGLDPEKVRRQLPCGDCSGGGKRVCPRCSGTGQVARVERRELKFVPTHELELKDGRVLKGRVVGSTKEMVMFQADGKKKARTYPRSRIKELRRLPEKD